MPTGKANIRTRSESFFRASSSRPRASRGAVLALALLLEPAVCLGKEGTAALPSPPRLGASETARKAASQRRPEAALSRVDARSENGRAPRPTDWTTDVVSTDRERFLTELRKRRIIDGAAEQWTPSEYTSLLRLREAERLGAFELLRSKLGTLRGFATEHEARGYKSLWLTVPGYERFIFLLSQDARAYFETRGAVAKFAYELRTVQGKRIFTDKGLLTQEGIEVYVRIRRKLPVFWRHGDGRVNGTVRPPESLLHPERALPPLAPRTQAEGGGDDGAALSRAAALLGSGYVELTEKELERLVAEGKTTPERLVQENSLQIIATKKKTFYLLSPSDPLMSAVSAMRGGQAVPPDLPAAGPKDAK